jgi:hypothetical protein
MSPASSGPRALHGRGHGAGDRGPRAARRCAGRADGEIKNMMRRLADPSACLTVRKVDGKFRAMSYLADDVDAASMSLDDRARNGQAQPTAGSTRSVSTSGCRTTTSA